MAAPVITITNDSDVAKGGAETDWSKVAPAAAGVGTTERIWNDLAGAGGIDDLRDVMLVPSAKLDGTTDWVGEGVDLLDRRGVQIKITKRNSVAVSEDWVNVGTGIHVTLPDLPAGEYHEYTARAMPPVGANDVVTDWKISLASTRFYVAGNPWAMPPGIRRGIGTGKTTAILARSIAIAVSGAGTFEWPDFSWIYEGVPHVVLDHDETISANDGSAVALGSGESYLYLAVLDGATTTIVKGDLVTGTAAYPTDAPTLPAGNRLLGWGVRDFTANLTFTSLDELPDFFNVTTSGLVATVARSGGPMIADGKLIDSSSATTATLTASSANTVQELASDGSVAVTTDGSLSADGAEILVDIITDGSGETSRLERRRWEPAAETIRFEFRSSPTGTITGIWINPHNRSLWIRSDSLRLMLDAVPGTPTHNVQADLFTRVDNGARTTLFTSSGSDDRRPIVANGDSTAINFGLPEVLEIPPNVALECDLIVTLATPSWAVVTLLADIG